MVTVQVGDVVWIRKPGNTSSPEEFLAAMEQIRTWDETRPPQELVRWNPWDYDELKENHGFDAATWAALQVRDDWRKKGDRRKPFDVDAWMAEEDAKFKREQLAKEVRWAKAVRHYDAERHDARLAMLEDQMSLRRVEEELAGYKNGTLFPKMDSARRSKEIVELEEQRARWRAEIGELAKKVGDLETVIDEHGRTPADRRQRNLLTYQFERERAIPQLRGRVAELQEQIAGAGNKRNHELESERSLLQQKLDQYLAVPPLTPDDMCADCAWPVLEHGWKLWPEGQQLCPAWPRHRAHLEETWAMLRRFADERQRREAWERQRAAEPAKRAKQAAKPKPIATLPAKMPIAEVMARLADLQKEHPDAELRNGSKGFEVWLPEPPKRKQ